MSQISRYLDVTAERGTAAATRLALLFWAFSYGVLTLRAVLRYEAPVLLTMHRILATAVGAAIYWFVLSRVDRRGDIRVAVALAVRSIVPAALCVMAARLVLSALWPWPGEAIADHVRWILAWSGYYAAWLLAGAALLLRHPAFAPRVMPAVVANDRTAEDTATRCEAFDAAALDWLVGRLADELAALPDTDRAALLARLSATGGYEIADGLDPNFAQARARANLLNRLFR